VLILDYFKWNFQL